MPEETATSSTSASMDEKPTSSNAATAEGLEDVLEEAKKLIGTGNRHMVMGDVVSAVGVFQDACGMLAEKYGDTADECGEAFFLCGKALLELARMENTVLGNALEGVPEESSEEGEKQNDSKFESTDNLDEETRDELREQVYDAMAEKENGEKGKEEAEKEATKESGEMVEDQAKVQEQADDPKLVKDEAVKEASEKIEAVPAAEASEKKAEDVPEAEAPEKKAEDVPADGTEAPKTNGAAKTEDKPLPEKNGDPSSEKAPLKTDTSEEVESQAKSEENGHGDEKQDEEMEVEEDGDDDDDEDDDDDDKEGEGNAEDKESEDEVGNLQLAWEMLEVAKVIYKRKEAKDDQLVTAQIFLKLGEVGAESGNYGQALDDFQDCLALQLKHLPPHSRLLAETHYQLGMTFSLTNEFRAAIDHFNSSIKVIETRVAMLQELISKAEGEEAAKEQRNELEELQQLLPDIKEKVEDSKESQRTTAAASFAIQQTMGGASTSSAFPSENGGASSSSTPVSQIPVKREAGDGAASSSKPTSDISHLVRKKASA
ncbi:nuclear autoantigenic sperm protein isoform X2 [Engraulis encrasicolus]|uniref:nuclear autoantigenic sperm protein isoform X2 n=1 Tax=Engraulis encrasicolus TaxID=184585 RepID=UPI002FCEA0D3